MKTEFKEKLIDFILALNIINFGILTIGSSDTSSWGFIQIVMIIIGMAIPALSLYAIVLRKKSDK